MSMDLWYDLAARELPDGEEAVIEKLEGVDAVSLRSEEPGGEPAEIGPARPTSSSA